MHEGARRGSSFAPNGPLGGIRSYAGARIDSQTGRPMTGREPTELIEFQQSQAFAMEKVATLTHAVPCSAMIFAANRRGSSTRSFATASRRCWRPRCWSGSAQSQPGLRSRGDFDRSGLRPPRRAIHRGERDKRHWARGGGLGRRGQRSGVANGLPPLPRHDADGAFARVAAGDGARRAHPSRTRRRLCRLRRSRARLWLA